jgi:tetratricopeptide (TPR) repeat protein
MRSLKALVAALLLVPGSALAQSDEIVVQGRRFQPSNWREAETTHVVVLSDGREGEVAEIAHNLERLYFLLSVLLDRAQKPDDTVKLRVTLIGGAAEFQAMDLRNLRWQQGPFNPAFDVSRYYDPREDGAVLATTRIDQKAVIERGTGMALLALQLPGAGTAESGGAIPPQGALFGLQSEPDLVAPANERSVPISAETMIYAGFAQHYLQTFFPAAYPRWYLDGFGQLFSTLVTRGDGVMEYGRAPEGSTTVLRNFGSYPLPDVLSGRYLDQPGKRTRWTPVHAWMLTHFLFFSPERNGQLRQYLKAIAAGTSADRAMAAFGDMDVLAKDLRRYFGAKKPYERMTYPAANAEAPIVRRLTQAQAAFVKGRLELGSRVEIPPVPAADADPTAAAQLTKARSEALEQRARWLQRLRTDATRFANDPDAQLLLAEAECRIGNAAECLAAANRALALSPGSAAALTWKGTAIAQQAAAAPPAERTATLREARATIGRANRIDTDAPLPLVAYYRSYAVVGDPLPAIAIDGLTRALMAVPNAPTTRLALGRALAQRGDAAAARTVLRPVALGGYESPERADAKAVLAALPTP